ncbi:MAG: MBOAT family protein [Bacteroidia bacterium]|nr:MBOAT family protein [Bacteroidia bacterium]
MIFSSSIFLFAFMPLFFACYYLVRQKWKNVVILLGSALFYAWGAPKFIFVIIGTTLLDFFLVQKMDATKTEWHRKILLVFSVCINLGLLIYFKYSNFFIENVNVLLAGIGFNQIHWTKLILPIGISFYTFETMTYVVDVYRRVHKPLKNFWEYQLYIILFPKLIAGPIIRFHELADQINDRRSTTTIDHVLTGFYRFVLGLAKKVIIANTMGMYADQIYGLDAATVSTLTAWLAALAYTMQIYFDFSGYSDMAIGLGKMMGFTFPENFNNPYTSQNITEFWRRWHITLGAWMRNYLYIPLGGNKVSSTGRLYFNLWLVFLASGLWHGASWSFIFWGCYHGLFLVLERAGLSKFYNNIGRIPSMIITFVIVLTGWVVFRIEDFGVAAVFLKKMYAFNFNAPLQFPVFDFWSTLLVAIIFSFFVLPVKGQKLQHRIFFGNYTVKRHLFMTCVSAILLFISATAILGSSFNPFIYFRF